MRCPALPPLAIPGNPWPAGRRLATVPAHASGGCRRAALAAGLGLVVACAPAERATSEPPAPFEPAALDLSAWPERVRAPIGEALEKARAHPSDAAAIGALGMQYYGADFPQAALGCFERAAQLDEASARWPYYLALALERAGDPPRAVAALETALEREPDAPFLLVALGGLLVGTDLDRAATLFRRAAEVDPRDARARFGLGECARRAGRREEALAEYEHAIGLFPSYAEAHYAAAMLLAGMGRRGEAEAHLARHVGGAAPPLANDPWREELVRLSVNASELRKRAERLAREGVMGEAAALLERSIAIDESKATSHVQMGVLLARQGRLEEAVSHFRQAVEDEPANVEARSSLGLALSDLGRKDEAERVWRSGLELHPAHAATLVYLGQHLSRTGRAAEGLAMLRRGVENQPANGLYRVALGEALLATRERGAAGEAVVHLERAADLLPRSAPVLENLARAYEASGRSDDAARTRRRAAALSGRPS